MAKVKLGPPVKLVSRPDVAASRLDEREMKRLSSETHRLLLMCQEHAMTLAELVGCFQEAEDPATPTAQELYQSLKRFGIKGGGSKPQNNFQVGINWSSSILYIVCSYESRTG